MRILESHELAMVSGAEGSESECPVEDGKNNNGYGNGAESGPPPGRSGLHNPQLTDWNLGPRGER